MKLFVMGISLLFSGLSLGQNLTKEDIKKSLDQMARSGMFTKEQIKAAEKQLMGMSDDQLNAVVQKGIEQSKDPKVQEQAQKIAEQMKQQKEAGN